MCLRPLPIKRHDFCPNCARDLGLVGVPCKDWPPAARALAKDHQREAYLLRQDREVLLGDEPEAERLLYGELYEDYAGIDTSGDWRFSDHAQSVEPTSDGTLQCSLCKETWSDMARTFPLEHWQWEQPRCPECGRVMYVSTDGPNVPMNEKQEEAANEPRERWQIVVGGRVKNASLRTLAPVLTGTRAGWFRHWGPGGAPTVFRHWSTRKVWSRGATGWKAEINESIAGHKQRVSFSGGGARRGIPSAIFAPRAILPRVRSGPIGSRGSAAGGVLAP